MVCFAGQVKAIGCVVTLFAVSVKTEAAFNGVEILEPVKGVPEPVFQL
jgi:hypothetical protein